MDNLVPVGEKRVRENQLTTTSLIDHLLFAIPCRLRAIGLALFLLPFRYNDLGDLYLDKLNKNHLTRNLVHRLERLGYSVTLTLQQIAA
jgi:hypothetical protein